tara:strand:- start:1456 stop:3066 length:1611 start_codon:yes stop_codon:yes gene_type:complete
MELLFSAIYVITIPKRLPMARALIDSLNASNAHIFNATLPSQLAPHRPTSKMEYRLAATNSHVRALCAIAAHNSTKPSLILEDDIVPSVPLAAMPTIVHNALEALPSDWDVLYLSRLHAVCEWDKPLKGGIKKDAGAVGTQAYVVNARVAGNLCYMGKQRIFSSAVLDNWMREMVRYKTLISFATQTPMFQEIHDGMLTPECVQDVYPWVKYAVAVGACVCVLSLRITSGAPRATILVNLLSAVGLIATIKVLFKTWPYPLAATALGFVAITIGLHSVPLVNIPRHYAALLSTLAAFSIVGANSSLRYNAVGTYELLKAFALPASVMINKAMTGESETRMGLALAVATFTFIVIGTAAHPYQTSTVGVLWGLIGAVSSAAEKSAVRMYKAHHAIDPVQLLKTTIPYSAVLIWIGSMATENPRWWNLTWKEMWLIGIMCLLVVTVASTAHSICGNAGPVTYMCLATAKTFTVVALFNSWGASTNTVGIVGAACMGAMYIWHKHRFQNVAEIDFDRLPNEGGKCCTDEAQKLACMANL